MNLTLLLKTWVESSPSFSLHKYYQKIIMWSLAVKNSSKDQGFKKTGMRPNAAFQNKPIEFWALVRYSSHLLGYTDRKTQCLKRYSLIKVRNKTSNLSICDNILRDAVSYLNYRAELLEKNIEPLLMHRYQAKIIFERLTANYSPKCPLPFNKQKGDKRHLNYFTCIINILTEFNLKSKNFLADPRELCLLAKEDKTPVMILSRQMDGVYPSTKNPLAVWEVKEYYGTTTFGSRVADGVYETQLDGYELLEAEKFLGRKVEHYLFVDDRFTWWALGKSYLCRLIDMMHMGLVDEIIFGKEVLTRWPEIVKSWA